MTTRPAKEPAMPFSHLPVAVSAWFAQIVGVLDRRSAPRLALLLLGALFVRGRRTVTSWFCAAGIRDAFRPAYNALWAAGRRADALAYRLLGCALQPLMRRTPGDHLLFALDDTPTPRYGPCVQGAGVHHNPSPGPAGEKYVYGHVWVTLAWLARHPWWDTLSLPLRALLYVLRQGRARVGQGLPLGVPHQAGVGRRPGPLADRVAGPDRQGPLADGRRRLRQAALPAACPGDGSGRIQPPAPGRRPAGLADDPTPTRPTRAVADLRQGQDRPGQLCRPETRLATGAMRAVRQAGDQDDQDVRGDLATGGGRLRVVIVRERDGWLPYFCTDPAVAAETILEVMADRGAIEQTFKDVKEVWGAGQQQVRNVYASIGAWAVNLTMYSVVEAWAWGRREESLVDRSRSPWDAEERRPSHADKRKALQREILREEIQTLVPQRRKRQEFQNLVIQLLDLAA